MEIAELDMGHDLSASVTPNFYTRLLGEIILVSEAVVCADDEIGRSGQSPTVAFERFSLSDEITGEQLAEIESLMQKGNRIAFVLPRSTVGIQVLESLGYERCERLSPGSTGLVRQWAACFVRVVPEARAGLVFCHDFDPAFVFDVPLD